MWFKGPNTFWDHCTSSVSVYWHDHGCFSCAAAGFSSCATCLWIWPVLFKLYSERPTGDHDSSSTTGELQTGTSRHLPWLYLCLYTNICLPLLRKDSILPWHESLSLAHVHLFLVLRHRCHGDRRLYLQVYRVSRVSGLWPGVGGGRRGGKRRRWIRIEF